MNTDMEQGNGEARRLWDLSERVLGACIEVHRHLGPGLLESAYEECLCHELSLKSLSFVRQRPVPVVYKGVKLDCGYRLDVVVEEKLVLELKAVDHLLPVHEAQVLTYLSGVLGPGRHGDRAWCGAGSRCLPTAWARVGDTSRRGALTA